jgi:hypothetical protein
LECIDFGGGSLGVEDVVDEGVGVEVGGGCHGRTSLRIGGWNPRGNRHERNPIEGGRRAVWAAVLERKLGKLVRLCILSGRMAVESA